MNKSFVGELALRGIENALLFEEPQYQEMQLRHYRDMLSGFDEHVEIAIIEQVLLAYGEELEQGTRQAQEAVAQLRYAGSLRIACQDLINYCERSAGLPPLAQALEYLAKVVNAALAGYNVGPVGEQDDNA